MQIPDLKPASASATLRHIPFQVKHSKLGAYKLDKCWIILLCYEGRNSQCRNMFPLFKSVNDVSAAQITNLVNIHDIPKASPPSKQKSFCFSKAKQVHLPLKMSSSCYMTVGPFHQICIHHSPIACHLVFVTAEMTSGKRGADLNLLRSRPACAIRAASVGARRHTCRRRFNASSRHSRGACSIFSSLL